MPTIISSCISLFDKQILKLPPLQPNQQENLQESLNHIVVRSPFFLSFEAWNSVIFSLVENELEERKLVMDEREGTTLIHTWSNASKGA